MVPRLHRDGGQRDAQAGGLRGPLAFHRAPVLEGPGATGQGRGDRAQAAQGGREDGPGPAHAGRGRAPPGRGGADRS
ncbi:hypothetical protein GO496_07940 [Acidovorax citrulli]|nr:hypothetical protein [Paracidovorax citrulli]